MAKKPNVAAFLDDALTRQQIEPQQQAEAPRRRSSTGAQHETVLVGANLPPRYAANIRILHAETGKDKKVILAEALDMYFAAKGGANLS